MSRLKNMFCLTLNLMLLRRPASAGPVAIPSALALTNAAEARVSSFTGTWSAMYRRLIALTFPNLQPDKHQTTLIS